MVKAHNIYSIKLVTLEEIIAAVVSKREHSILVTRPLLFTESALVPWFLSIEPSNAEALEIYLHAIIAKVKVSAELADSYREISGIAKAPASILQGL